MENRNFLFFLLFIIFATFAVIAENKTQAIRPEEQPYALKEAILPEDKEKIINKILKIEKNNDNYDPPRPQDYHNSAVVTCF